MKRRIKNEDIDDIGDKLDTLLLTGKAFNESVNSLNVLDGMLICVLAKIEDERVEEEINGIRLYLNQIIEDMENLSESE